MLKRLASIGLVLALTGVLAACGNNSNNTNVGSVSVDWTGNDISVDAIGDSGYRFRFRRRHFGAEGDHTFLHRDLAHGVGDVELLAVAGQAGEAHRAGRPVLCERTKAILLKACGTAPSA